MSDLIVCSSCGLPLNAPAAGLCPNCLMNLGVAATEMADSAGSGSLTAGLRAGLQNLGAPPTRIGPYRLVRKLGEGGMGVVYLAEQDEPIRRTVALKLIKLGMDTAEVVSRFAGERQALALMEHKNIAHVYDAGSTVDGRPYFVMEYVQGAPITDYCDAHRLTTRQRVELFLDVCGALQHAHQKGIIHRDLKPSNIVVADQDGRPVPKVIDFGIAKAVDQHGAERIAFTRRGCLIGTPEYMSPEQADSDNGDIDTRTDIYALGVILYEMLVGHLPFSADRLRQAGYTELLRILHEEEPPRPSRRLTPIGSPAGDADTASRRRTTLAGLASELRGDLDWITLKALEKDRTHRYASASELAADLTRSLDNEPVLARPPSTPYRLRKFVRRNRLIVGAAAAIVLVVVSGLIATVTMYVGAERARQEADAQRVAADEQRAAASTQRQEAEQQASRADAARADADAQKSLAELALRTAEDNLYFNNLTLASREWAEGNIAYVDQLLQQAPARLRGWEWNVLARLSHMNAGEIRSPSRILAMVFTPDGRRLVTAGEGAIATWEVPSGRRIGSATYPTSLDSRGAPVLSPDGRILLVRGPGGEAVATDTTSGKPLFSVGPPGKIVTRAVFSPDASRIAAVIRQVKASERDPGNGVAMWDARTGASLWQLPGESIHSCLTFSPDGERLALVTETKLTLVEVSTGTRGAMREVPDGTCPNVEIAQVEAGRSGSFFDVGPLSMLGGDVVLGPRGVLTGSFIKSNGQIRMADADGASLWSIPARSGAAVGSSAVLTSSPNGGVLAALGDNLPRLIEPESGRVLSALPGHKDPPHRLAFSGDGMWLASAEPGGRVLMWSTAGWRQASLVVNEEKGFDIYGVSQDLEHIVMWSSFAGSRPSGWSLQTAQRDWTAPAGSTLPPSLEYSADASRVAALQIVYVDRGNGTAATGYRVTVLDRRTGAPSRPFGLLPPGSEITNQSQLIGKLHADDWSSSTMKWSLDGRVLAVTHSGTQTGPSCHGEVWDAGSGTLLRQFGPAAPPGFRCDRTSLTPDASSALQLLQPLDPRANRVLTPRLFDVASGRVLWTASAIESAAAYPVPVFSRDGRAVALSAFQGGVDILEVRTGTRIARLPAAAALVVFSPDGRRIATVTTQGSVQLWDAVSGRQLLTLPDAPGACRTTSWTLPDSTRGSGPVGLAFSADGRELIMLMRIRSTTPAGSQTRLERRVWDGSALPPQR